MTGLGEWRRQPAAATAFTAALADAIDMPWARGADALPWSVRARKPVTRISGEIIDISPDRARMHQRRADTRGDQPLDQCGKTFSAASNSYHF